MALLVLAAAPGPAGRIVDEPRFTPLPVPPCTALLLLFGALLMLGLLLLTLMFMLFAGLLLLLFRLYPYTPPLLLALPLIATLPLLLPGGTFRLALFCNDTLFEI